MAAEIQDRFHTDSLWITTLRRYLIVAGAASLLWEFAQVSLYTLWRDGTAAAIVFAVLHCTAGDILIATATLVLALLVASNGWPLDRRAYRRVGAIAIALGIGYTGASEWVNTAVRNSWAYTEIMPLLPVIKIGLTPLAQWLIVPLAASIAASPRGSNTLAHQFNHRR